MLCFIPVDEREIDTAFTIYAEAMRMYVQMAFGWDEDHQYERFVDSYPLESMNWLMSEDEKVALVCTVEQPECLHLALLIVVPEHRCKGFGTWVIDTLSEAARQSGRALSLITFRRNTLARTIYVNAGFQVVASDDDFLYMKRQFVAQVSQTLP